MLLKYLDKMSITVVAEDSVLYKALIGDSMAFLF